MEYISIFSVLKIGVGPSSSHTLGPWRAAQRFISDITSQNLIKPSSRIIVSLYGSLSLTGKGHSTDAAICLGLSGYDPVTIPTDQISSLLNQIHERKALEISGYGKVAFDPKIDIHFEESFLPFHANGMQFSLFNDDKCISSDVYYSTGGGFIIKEGEMADSSNQLDNSHPFPINTSKDLITWTQKSGLSISGVVLSNELIDRTEDQIKHELLDIWNVMLDSIYTGCHTVGVLPGGLNVRRRAAEITNKLMPEKDYTNAEEWLVKLKNSKPSFQDVMKWVGTFAIAVNEVNAALGRVVTAPTNGSAGVIPAVLLYYISFVNPNATEEEIVRYLCTCGEIGAIFKKQSTISAAMGGCQAEIGVSSAMAAAGLTELLGGSPQHCTIAAEVAMEHHLGMTCDPVAGLVQVPCIERNSMGAIKAINAAAIAIDRNPDDVKVSLDNVIATMWETAQDMNRKYKETSEGGLAIAVNQIDC
jgi:L-serine dehydratase